MNVKKYADNITDFLYEEDKRVKLTVSISSSNKEKIRKMKINASKLIDSFLTDFFQELEKSTPKRRKTSSRRNTSRRQKEDKGEINSTSE